MRGHVICLSVATLTTLSRESMQTLSVSTPPLLGLHFHFQFFLLRVDTFPTVDSLLLLLAGGMELKPGPTHYACGRTPNTAKLIPAY